MLLFQYNTSSFFLFRILNHYIFFRLPRRLVQNRRFFTTLLESFFIFLIIRVKFVQFQLIQIFKMLTNRLEFFIFNANEICHFRLHLQTLCRFSTVTPQKIHLPTHQTRILLLPQLLHHRQQIFRNLTSPIHHLCHILQLTLNKLIDICFQSFQSVTVCLHSRGKLLGWLLLFEHPSNKLFETDRHELVLVILVTMDLLAGLVIALQTEECVLLASLVETDHPCLFFVYALWEIFNLDRDVRCRKSFLLFFHSNQYIQPFQTPSVPIRNVLDYRTKDKICVIYMIKSKDVKFPYSQVNFELK